jgi:hypothetical protein
VRPAILVFGLLTVGGGCSNYVTEKTLPTGCVETKYYLDADQDGWGWGDPDEDFRKSCSPLLDEKYTARNALDCDDSTNLVTGRVGSVCPQDTAKAPNLYAGQIVGTREYVAIMGGTLSGSEAAAGSCGTYGWGGKGATENGGLAVFTSMQGLFRTIKEIDDVLAKSNVSGYAAWVGIEYTGEGWTFSRDSEGFEPAEMGYCSGSVPDPADFTHGPKQLALVRKHTSGDWCFGRPTDANPRGDAADEDQVYTDWAANFVCERPRPDSRCYVLQSEEPWLEPCSCRVARGESLDTLTPSEDPDTALGPDKGTYFTEFDSKLCLDG